MQSGIPTEPTRVAAGTHQLTVCPGPIRPRVEEIPVGSDKDPKGLEASNSNRGLHRLRQPRSTHKRSSTGGAGICDGGGRGPGRHGRHDGATAGDRSGCIGTADVPISAADIQPGSPNGIRDASDRTSFKHYSSVTKLS